MKGDFDWGNLVHWAKDDLELALDEEFSISEERAKELLAQIAETRKMEKPLMELVAAYGNQIRRILAARVLDKTELEAEENDFWAKIVHIAGNYGGRSPVKHWLSVIAKRQAIDSHRRLRRRMKRVVFRAEMASEMLDAGEKDDLDLESLADESIAALRSVQPDEAMEQEEKEAAADRLVRYLEQSEDSATRLIFRRYIEGASYEQMVEEEHTTCSNMRRRVSRAIASRRQTLIDVYQGV